MSPREFAGFGGGEIEPDSLPGVEPTIRESRTVAPRRVRRYARLYATPAEVARIVVKAAKGPCALSDYVRLCLGLPVTRQSSAITAAKGSAHHKTQVCVQIALKSEEEAAKITEAAKAIDATDSDYIRMKCGLKRTRARRVTIGPAATRAKDKA